MNPLAGKLAICVLVWICLQIRLSAMVLYVDVNNAVPAPPYATWTTAATNIQTAIDAAADGDQILVADGVYATGGRLANGAITNRVAVTKALAVQSVNGPLSTIIRGYQLPGATNGAGAIRCVYLTNGAFLSGFSLTNGATLDYRYDTPSQCGGGVWCESTNAAVSNCVVAGNSAYAAGGGAYGGTLDGCTLTANTAGIFGNGGGACSNTLLNCTLTGNSAAAGGGAFGGTLDHCTVSGNTARDNGGGAFGGTLSHCLLIGNSTPYDGGGAYGTALSDSVLSGNSASAGGGAYEGSANRCSIIGNSASSGGGLCAVSNANNCIVISNSATASGGGSNGGILNNCLLIGNSAESGGGALGGMLVNCTLTANVAASLGGGANGAALTNCLLYYNQAPAANYFGGTLSFCCTTPLPPAGSGNLEADPRLASPSHLSAVSPCLGKGSSDALTGVDIDGEPWASPPSIGCDELRPGSATGPLSVAIKASYTTVATGFSINFQALIDGQATSSRWDFGDGTVVTNRPFASHFWTTTNHHPVTLQAYNDSYPSGLAATVTVQVVTQAVYFVRSSNSSPTAPYGSWAQAATNIQTAVDAAPVPGSLILVSNGIYGTGSRNVSGNNRVAVNRPVIVRSVNGPDVTVIKGNRVPGSSAVRGVYLMTGAMLAGFTVTNGATQTSGGYDAEQAGGGVLAAPGSVISNCLIVANSASVLGGGAHGGLLQGCLISNNLAYSLGGGVCDSILTHCQICSNSASSDSGGADESTLDFCTLTGNSTWRSGGGAYESVLNNCRLIGNTASWTNSIGGGTYYCMLNNCVIASNSVAGMAGGAVGGTLNNCTIIGNTSSRYRNACGGVLSSTLHNCIVYFNSAPNGDDNYRGSIGPSFCCLTPMPTNGLGNIADPPLFMDLPGGDFRLASNSPCLDAGNNTWATGADLDGRPRIVGVALDIGAFEYQGPVLAGYLSWLRQYGLPTEIASDATDTDGDGLNNWQEWIAGTDPTNSLSVLKLYAPANQAPGLTVSWQSVGGKSYFLQRSTNLLAPFTLLQSNLAGQLNTTVYTDTTATHGASYFYRVGVQ